MYFYFLKYFIIYLFLKNFFLKFFGYSPYSLFHYIIIYIILCINFLQIEAKKKN